MKLLLSDAPVQILNNRRGKTLPVKSRDEPACHSCLGAEAMGPSPERNRARPGLVGSAGVRATARPAFSARTRAASVNTAQGNRTMGKGLLLWLLGIPIPVIILLYLFHVI